MRDTEDAKGEENLSRCFRCGATEVETRRTEEYVREGRYVVALAVECQVCASCGERYFAGDTVRLLERTRSRIRSGDLEGLAVTGELLEPAAS